MSEFKFVQWGLGVPVDYQRLNAMMLNEDYVKQLAEPAPRGIIKRVNVAGANYTSPTGGNQNVSGLSDIKFTTEANRIISFEFQSGRIRLDTADQILELRFSFIVDGVKEPMPVGASDHSGTVMYHTGSNGHYDPGSFTLNYGAPVVFTYVPSTALSAGDHTVTASFVSNAVASTFAIGDNSTNSVIIRDEGSFAKLQ